jgi:hypothetical protein
VSEAQPLGTGYHVLSVTLGADGPTTLTLDADVGGTRQIVHHPGGPLTYEIAQLMHENAALRAQVVELQAQTAHVGEEE